MKPYTDRRFPRQWSTECAKTPKRCILRRKATRGARRDEAVQ